MYVTLFGSFACCEIELDEITRYFYPGLIIQAILRKRIWVPIEK